MSDGGGTVLIDEDFGDYPVGDFPPEWETAGNSDQEVVSDPSISADRAFSYSGRAGGCWEAIAQSPPVPAIAAEGTTVISGHIRVGSGEQGCHSDTAQVAISTCDDGWSCGEKERFFGFADSGLIEVSGADEDLGQWTDHQWYLFTVTYERDDGQVTYTVEIGDETATVTHDEGGFEDDIAHLWLNTGGYTNYVDNLEVTHYDLDEERDDSSSDQGIVTGVVTDDSGELLTDASVVFFDVETEHIEGSVTTDADGRYSIELSPGPYEATAAKNDFESSSSRVTVQEDVPASLDFELSTAEHDGSDTDKRQDDPPTDSGLQSQLQDATTVAVVTIGGNEYQVLQDIPGEPDDRFAYADNQYRPLESALATNVAISYTYCNAYIADSERRLKYTNEQYEEFGSLERMARAANLLSDLSGVIALAKISPISSASNAVDTLQTAIDWGAHELSDPYHEQFAKMAAASSTVEWADTRLPSPERPLVDPADDVLEVTQTMLGAADVVDAADDLAQSAATVHEIVSRADSIRDSVPTGAVDGADDLAPTAFTLLFGLAVDATVDSVSGVAEGQARAAAIGKGQAAARRPLLHELLELEDRVTNFELGPAGILRIQALRQTDYQIEAAALYGQADIIETYQSTTLGSIIARVNGTEELPAAARSTAETFRDLSQFQIATTGELFRQALDAYSDSLNAKEYGDQNLFPNP